MPRRIPPSKHFPRKPTGERLFSKGEKGSFARKKVFREEALRISHQIRELDAKIAAARRTKTSESERKLIALLEASQRLSRDLGRLNARKRNPTG